MNIKQYKTDCVFSGLLNDGDNYAFRTFYDDVEKIKELLKQYNVVLSSAEVVYFWEWRSNQYDASWLAIINYNEVVEWFDKFLAEHSDWYEDYLEE